MTQEKTRENKLNWIASNWFRLSILLLSFGTVSFFFYWYSIRPSQIKQACSWVKKHSNAIQARKGMTQEELKSKGLIKACPTDIPGKGLLSNKDGILCNMQNWEVY
jgi:hypothetical protein